MKLKKTKGFRVGEFHILVGDPAYQAFAEELRALQAQWPVRAQAAGLTEEDVTEEVRAFRRGE